MFTKIYKWAIAFGPTILGILEAVLKILKELLTLIVDILFPLMPIAKFKAFVTWLRALVDKAYGVVSKLKEKLLLKL